LSRPFALSERGCNQYADVNCALLHK